MCVCVCGGEKQPPTARAETFCGEFSRELRRRRGGGDVAAMAVGGPEMVRARDNGLLLTGLSAMARGREGESRIGLIGE